VIEQTGILKGRRRRAVDSTILADAVATQDTVTQLVSALVNDANALVAAFAGGKLDEPAASAVALLALVAGQDVEPAGGSDGTDGRWRIARKVAEDRVISTVDPQARHTRKSPEARRDGYRAHVAADPETGIITDEKLTGAAGTANSDAAVAVEFVAAGTPAGGGDGHHDDASPACLVRRFGLRHRGPAPRDRRSRAPGGDQALAAPARRRRWLHRR
jgi:hypothetical protein